MLVEVKRRERMRDDDCGRARCKEWRNLGQAILCSAARHINYGMCGKSCNR